MGWTYHVKPEHWVSSPGEFFIVQEEGPDSRRKYVVYRGQFANWARNGAEGTDLERIGEFVTLKDAKNDTRLQTSL